MVYETTFRGHKAKVEIEGNTAYVNIEGRGGGWVLSTGDEKRDFEKFVEMFEDPEIDNIDEAGIRELHKEKLEQYTRARMKLGRLQNEVDELSTELKELEGIAKEKNWNLEVGDEK